MHSRKTPSPLWARPSALSSALALAALLSAGCDDDNPAAEGQNDTGLAGDAAITDRGAPGDAAADATPVDLGPPPHLEAPEALLYANDPITDDGQLTRVTLTQTTPTDGRLTSPFVEVFNCLNEPGGVTAMPDLGGLRITISLCREAQVARPGPDGHYSHIAPPEDDSDPNDVFSELMMYHHVNRVHDYFKQNHGLTRLDFPLPAIVNLQLRTEPPLPIPGFMPGPDGWIPFANAAFFPREAWEQFAAQFGLPPRDSDTIIFGQAEQDFAYDSRVIYHEYGHAVIGTGRLQAIATLDEYGLDNSSRSMNEGLADYFAATLADDPAVGRYGLGTIDPSFLRDLSVPHRCPADTADEIHDHGKVIGSALWALREALGAEAADAVLWGALEQFTEATGHQDAGALLLAEAEARGLAAQAEPILSDFGLLGCERAVPWVEFEASRARGPHVVEGRQTAGLPGLSGGVPGYKQFYVDVPAGAAAVTLSWTQLSTSSIFGSSSPVALELGLRRGAPVQVGARADERFTLDARLAPPLLGDAQSLTLTGDCLPAGGGRIYLLPINPASAASTIGAMGIELPAVAPTPGPGRTLFDCAAEAPGPDGGVSDGGAEDAGAGDLGAGDLGAGDLGAEDAGDAGVSADAAGLDAIVEDASGA